MKKAPTVEWYVVQSKTTGNYTVCEGLEEAQQLVKYMKNHGHKVILWEM